jgi:hypothetical protein
VKVIRESGRLRNLVVEISSKTPYDSRTRAGVSQWLAAGLTRGHFHLSRGRQGIAIGAYSTAHTIYPSPFRVDGSDRLTPHLPRSAIAGGQKRRSGRRAVLGDRDDAVSPRSNGRSWVNRALRQSWRTSRHSRIDFAGPAGMPIAQPCRSSRSPRLLHTPPRAVN